MNSSEDTNDNTLEPNDMVLLLDILIHNINNSFKNQQKLTVVN